ncbi:ANK-REP-REGION domain-containing protein [Mycena venus]|uniref:ANK-REP-REGION domain-containing protein n=1 Tax=Mycena venus TaxID=2733690 RepID=A0A8H7D1W5_9AGAR|nr:ANK-REP-REGION domain-containing protein [Mycena venus]
MSSPSVLPDLNPTYGALLVGVYFAIFFQGVLTVQTYIYFESFPEDPWGMKSLVTIVWLLDVAHLVLICQTAYYYLVSNWGNQQALLSTIPILDLHLILMTLSIMACQSFYVNRVWKFSKNILLTGLLGTASLTSGILYFTLTAQLLQNRSVETILKRTYLSETIAVFSVGAAVDLAIAILMVWYLGRERTTFDRVKSLVTRLIQVSVATGLATSLLALGCLIALVASADSLIFVAIHVSLGRTYTNALLATLNSRKRPACASGTSS